MNSLAQSVIYSYCIGFTLISASILIDDILREGNDTRAAAPTPVSNYADGKSSVSRDISRDWTLISPIFVTSSGTIVEKPMETRGNNFTANHNSNDAMENEKKKAPAKRGTTSKGRHNEDDDSYDDISSESLDGDQHDSKNSTVLTTVAPRPERKEYDSKSYSNFLKSLSALTNLPVNYNGTAIIVTTGPVDSTSNDSTSIVAATTSSSSMPARPAEMEEEGEREATNSETQPESAVSKRRKSERLKLSGVLNFPPPSAPYFTFFNPFPSQPFGSFPYGVSGNPFIGQPNFGTQNVNQMNPTSDSNNVPKNIQNYGYYNPSSSLQHSNPAYNSGFSNYPQNGQNEFSPTGITTQQNNPTEFRPNIAAIKTAAEVPTFRPNFNQITSPNANPNAAYYFPGSPNPASYQGGLSPVFAQPTASATPNDIPGGQDQKGARPRPNNIGRNAIGLFSLQDYFGGVSQQWPAANSATTESTSHQDLLPLSNAKEGNHKVLSSVTSVDGSNNKSPENSANDNSENGGCEEWTTWPKCSQKCGGCGQKRRERVCAGGLELERKSCHLRACEYPEPACCEGRVPRMVNSVTLCLNA